MRRFKAEKFTDGEFFFYLADIFVMQVQYGSRTFLCDSMLKGKTLEQQMDAVVEQAQHLDIESYSSFFLSDPTYDVDRNGRQWYYQTCEEVGWMQTAPKDERLSMRSQILNVDFWRQWCHDSFGTNSAGEPLFPDTEETNAYLGGKDLNVHHLIMTNGSEDPWKRASVIEQANNDLVILHIECDNCAHCVDLKTPRDTDAQNLKIAREKIKMYFDQWIGEHYQQIKE